WMKGFEISKLFALFSRSFEVGDFCSRKLRKLDTHPFLHRPINSAQLSLRPDHAVHLKKFRFRSAPCLVHAVSIKPVSAWVFPETGIFRRLAADYARSPGMMDSG